MRKKCKGCLAGQCYLQIMELTELTYISTLDVKETP